MNLTVSKYLSKLSPKPPSSSFVCTINTRGEQVCYNNQYENTILCDNEKCLINYKTLDQSYINKPLPQNIKINLYEKGQFTLIQLIGVFSKNELNTMLKMFPNVSVRQTQNLNDPYFGIPKKSLKCKLNPFSKDKRCKNYL